MASLAASSDGQVGTTWATLNARVRSRRPQSFESLGSQPYREVPSEEILQQEILELRKPYEGLTPADVRDFQTRRYLRLRNVLPPGLLSAARERIIRMATKATGGRNVSLPAKTPRQSNGTADDTERLWNEVSEPTTRSWNIQMMWAVDPVVRAIVLSPRIGDIVCKLLDCDNVRMYHDNFLSRVPGSKRTLWHCDDGPNGYMALSGRKVVTVWFPLHRTTPENGALVFPRSDDEEKVANGEVRGVAKRSLDSWDVAKLDGCPKEEQSDEYDEFCASALESSGARPDTWTYELGDLSIHATDCFHSAGPNLSGNVRNIIAATYFSDKTTMRTDKCLETMSKGQLCDWKKFAPGVQPGEEVCTKFNPVLPHSP